MNQTDYFTEKIASLPEDLQAAIRASNHQTTLKNIQREYKLHIDQAQTLETLATQLIFGDIDAPQFVNSMFNEAHISSAVAGDILLQIDTLILKKIRVYMEQLEDDKKHEAELRRLLMSDEEEMEEDKANAYAAYYAETANILREKEQELLDKGIQPDGSNITDEMIAQEMGISIEEFNRRNQTGALKEARDSDNQTTTQVESSINTKNEKEELLHELESPEKSFIKPLFTPISNGIPKTAAQTSVAKNIVSEKIILPDHQLQNTHVETPYIEEIVPEKQSAPVTQSPAVTVTPPAPTPTQTVNPTTKLDPMIKRPTKITLQNDPYKEPIE